MRCQSIRKLQRDQERPTSHLNIIYLIFIRAARCFAKPKLGVDVARVKDVDVGGFPPTPMPPVTPAAVEAGSDADGRAAAVGVAIGVGRG